MSGIPAEAIGALSGLYYKIGLHGCAYYWNDEEWIKSAEPASKIVEAIERKEFRFDLDTSSYHWG
jgi:hypothetical protein